MPRLISRRRFLALSAGLAIFGWLCTTGVLGRTVDATDEVHWDYYEHGGAADWGALSEPGSDAVAYPDCNLAQQSPVDIPREASLTAGPAIDYRPTRLVVANNGHTVQVPYDPGSSLTLDGEAYELLQFHFHTPSEHSVHGRGSPLEVHFVHRAANGVLLVLGVMVETGQPNAAFEQVLDVMPQEVGTAHSSGALDASAFLPDDLSHYAYDGSLTTPPCSEGVLWKLLRQPISASEEQIARFRALPFLNHEGDFIGNARPLQPLNGRFGTDTPIRPPVTGTAGLGRQPTTGNRQPATGNRQPTRLYRLSQPSGSDGRRVMPCSWGCALPEMP